MHIRFLGKMGERIGAPTVALVRLAGVIGDRGGYLRNGGLSLAGIGRQLERAFTLPRLRAVALMINSPGGSPVQSALLQRKIRALAAEHAVPVLAFVEDVAASGGYWIALGADEIYADASSIIGSIGVISAGFGFAELIARYGIERRLHTSGERKGMLDPFLAERAEDVERLKAIQREMHESFKQLVRVRRAEKLTGDERELFSGEFWTGKRSLELGLIDGLADAPTLLRERFGKTVKLVPVGERRGWLRRRFSVGANPSPLAEWTAGILAAVEERALWSRFGL
ncbi:MAG: S49 family peptidase [Alphaproteobacteria bacterium]|nr:S49 family peptidase [Alphaproteobacteria bacterium]